MKISEIVQSLDCTVLHRGSNFDSEDIRFAAAGDLMSDVLVVDEEGVLIITALTSDQVLRTADIVGAAGILLVSGKKPQQNLQKLAAEFDISLISSPLSMFESCCAVGKLFGRTE